MSSTKRVWLNRISGLLLLSGLSTGIGYGQSGVDSALLLKPTPDSWPSYHGDYSGRRHSPLTQINQRNVQDLTLAWAFQTNQPATIKSSPLMVDGVLYFTVPDNIWAVDARSGLCFGTSTSHRPRATISASVAWRCTRVTCTSLLLTIT